MGRAPATRGLMRIGDVAERTGLSLRSIRHYEDVGLLSPSERSPGGFRLYTEAAVARLLVVRGMKPLDFTLEQMRDLLDVVDGLEDEDAAPEQVAALRARLVDYQEVVGEGVATLRSRLANALALRTALDHLLSAPADEAVATVG